MKIVVYRALIYTLSEFLGEMSSDISPPKHQ